MNREKLKFAIKWGLYAFFVIAAFGPLRTFFSHSLPGFLLIPKVNFPVLRMNKDTASWVANNNCYPSSCHKLAILLCLHGLARDRNNCPSFG